MRYAAAILLILIGSVTFGNAVEITLSAVPEAYTSFDEAYQSEPLRLQYGGGLTTGIIIPLHNTLDITIKGGVRTRAQSKPYGLVVQRGFTSLTAGTGVNLSFNDFGGMEILAEGNYSTYLGTHIKFAHVSFSLSPYVHLFRDPLDISLALRLSYDMRRDVDHNASAGIGIRASLPIQGGRK